MVPVKKIYSELQFLPNGSSIKFTSQYRRIYIYQIKNVEITNNYSQYTLTPFNYSRVNINCK